MTCEKSNSKMWLYFWVFMIFSDLSDCIFLNSKLKKIRKIPSPISRWCALSCKHDHTKIVSIQTTNHLPDNNYAYFKCVPLQPFNPPQLPKLWSFAWTLEHCQTLRYIFYNNWMRNFSVTWIETHTILGNAVINWSKSVRQMFPLALMKIFA